MTEPQTTEPDTTDPGKTDADTAWMTIAIAGLLLVGLAVGAVNRAERLDSIQATRPLAYRVDLNHAEASTLCLLPTIGPGIAQRIVDDRQALGPYPDLETLKRVPYVGDKTAEAIEPWVVLVPPAKPQAEAPAKP